MPESRLDVYLSMIIYPISFIIFILLCILYLFLFINDQQTKTHYIILISLILSMIYCILSFIFIDGNVLLFKRYDIYGCFYGCLISGIIVLQRTCVYSFHAYKSKLSFTGSVFEIKKYIFIIVYLILAFICLGYFLLLYILSYKYPTFQCSNNIYIGIILAVFVLMDILFAFISTKVFAVRIKKLLKIQMVPGMKFIVHKLTTLTIISILSSIIFILIFGLILNIYIKPYKIFAIDLIINNITLMCTFGKGNIIYNKLCCCFNFKEFQLSLNKHRSNAVVGRSPTITGPPSGWKTPVTPNSPTKVPLTKGDSADSRELNDNNDNNKNTRNSITTDTNQKRKQYNPTITHFDFDAEMAVKQSRDISIILDVNGVGTTKLKDTNITRESIGINKILKLPYKNKSYSLSNSLQLASKNGGHHSNSIKLPYINKSNSHSNRLQLPHNNSSNSIQLTYKNKSNSLRLPYKNYSNSSNICSLASQDSVSISQQIITKNSEPDKLTVNISATMPTVTETKSTVHFKSLSNTERLRRDSIDKFVSSMVELQEPTGIEGNEVESTTNNKTSTSNDDNDIDILYDETSEIDWNNLTINIDDDNEDEIIEDSYEVLKRTTPSTCVKQMKELGIIM